MLPEDLIRELTEIARSAHSYDEALLRVRRRIDEYLKTASMIDIFGIVTAYYTKGGD